MEAKMEKIDVNVVKFEVKVEADKFKEEILREYPKAEVYRDPLSLSVSCHIGPGALAVALSNVPKELCE